MAPLTCTLLLHRHLRCCESKATAFNECLRTRHICSFHFMMLTPSNIKVHVPNAATSPQPSWDSQCCRPLSAPVPQGHGSAGAGAAGSTTALQGVQAQRGAAGRLPTGGTGSTAPTGAWAPQGGRGSTATAMGQCFPCATLLGCSC